MHKLLIILLIFFIYPLTSDASHITGGEMYYTLIRSNNGIYDYSVTLKLFQRCNSGRQFPDPAIISVFDKTYNTRIKDINVMISFTEQISITDYNPCISNPPVVCYDVAYYTFSVSLPASADGYILASQVNYRINGINNLQSGSGNIGATYTTEIPGTGIIADGPENNSAQFTGSDLVIVCANNNFNYSFKAEDSDGDSLRYSFCYALKSTSEGGGGVLPTAPPPFPSVPYNTPGFSDSHPLGPGVNIDPNTGWVSGIAPEIGIYVLTVCVNEIRNGKVIASQRKDIQINIADCNIAAASLFPKYSLCRNTQTIQLSNLSTSPLITTTNWQFYNNTGSMIHSSTESSVNYTFPDTGRYTVKLIINQNQSCTDSTSAIINVYPGFYPEFNVSGICFNKPTVFNDLTSSVYGIPNSWIWDFGESSTSVDIASVQNPVYTYPALGIKNIQLIASDSKGCTDTIHKTINIIEKPPIDLAFNDTLICINDSLKLQANGTGIIGWSPAINIINANTPTPTVMPASTTTYYVDLDDNGCKNRDSVTVNVVNFVSLQAMNDTVICQGDTIQLSIISDGLQYNWSPSASIIDPTIKNPFVITSGTTEYTVTAVIGGCKSTEKIKVETVPYPVVDAGKDQIICYNSAVQLNGRVTGSSWQWTPAVYTSNADLLNPVAYPPRSTDFILTAYDTKGCPKPGRDTVKITVLPKMNVSAGTDTAVVINQPVQLNASGGVAYSWFPADYLSANNIADPIAIFDLNSEDIRYKLTAYNEAGCIDSAFLTIKVYKTVPSVFVPSAFTPNNDGKNDILRPIAAGMKNIERFNIYNRWGQLLFSTKLNGDGWDGKVNGQPQASGTFIWMIQAIDYTGKPYFKKGLCTLIR